jgi:release factor glutamine methyltransferase
MTTVAAAVDHAVADLCRAGFPRDEARRDAVVIARGLLQWSLADWLARSTAEAPESFQSAFTDLVSRRGTREPVAYLLGEKEFYGRPFRVTPDTLIPRPETEDLVEAALTWLRARVAQPVRSVRIVDVGTGTGCVAISIALEVRGAAPHTVTATDSSVAALAVARENAARLGAPAIEFKAGHLLAGAAEPIDLIVSNPPYVPAGDRETLQADVVQFEPAKALFGGEDGLAVIRELITESRRALAPGGALMLEIGLGQADQVAQLLQDAGFTAIERRPDLQRIDRVIVAHLPGHSL